MTHNLNLRLNVADESVDAADLKLTGTARTTCTCGLDTGTVSIDQASNATIEHEGVIALNLPA